MEWQPPETAPKDRVILGAFKHGQVKSCVWNDPEKTWCSATPQTGLYLGEYNDHYFECDFTDELEQWLPMPEVEG